MRRAAALLALGLVPLTAVPASAGCADDYLAHSRELKVSTVVGTVEIGSDYSVTARPGWAIAYAAGERNRVLWFVDCVA